MKKNHNKRKHHSDSAESREEKRGAAEAECEEDSKTPKAFVIKRGIVTAAVKQLVADWRLLMLPFTSLKLKERKSNSLLDFVAASSLFGVSHLMAFTQTSTAPYWKVARLPSGPTLTFRVHEFSLMRDVRKHQRKSRISKMDFRKSPIVVLRGFKKKTDDGKVAKNENAAANSESLDGSGKSRGGSGSPVPSEGPVPLHLLSLMLGRMFPSININSVTAADCRRVVLFSYDRKTEMMEVRHYSVIKRGLEVTREIQNVIRIGRNPKKIFSKKMIEEVVKLKCKKDDRMKVEDESEDDDEDGDNNDEGGDGDAVDEDLKEIRIFVKPKENESGHTKRLAVR